MSAAVDLCLLNLCLAVCLAMSGGVSGCVSRSVFRSISLRKEHVETSRVFALMSTLSI